MIHVETTQYNEESHMKKATVEEYIQYLIDKLQRVQVRVFCRFGANMVP